MTNKLIQRYNEIEAEVSALRHLINPETDQAAIQEQMTQLETKQTELKKTLLHLVALSKIRDEAWLALRIE